MNRNKTALVLAAHGSRHEPAVNAQVHAWATHAAELRVFDEVAPAFHHGSPEFSEVLDGLSADEVTVVPVMTSTGYFCDVVLPRELARNRRSPGIALRQTDPVGLHPAITGLMANRASLLALNYDFAPHSAITLAIVGHGTPRHRASRNSTFSLVEQLQATNTFGEVLALFLDDEPAVEKLLAAATQPDIMVLPFLIAAGPHATSDVPRRIGVDLRNSSGPPFLASMAGRRVVCDMPFGCHPGLIDLILDLATATSDQIFRALAEAQEEIA